eukprot:scaffold69_cov248-Pinguiococcus_pyrenoidosus.AAC.46
MNAPREQVQEAASGDHQNLVAGVHDADAQRSQELLAARLQHRRHRGAQRHQGGAAQALRKSGPVVRRLHEDVEGSGRQRGDKGSRQVHDEAGLQRRPRRVRRAIELRWALAKVRDLKLGGVPFVTVFDRRHVHGSVVRQVEVDVVALDGFRTCRVGQKQLRVSDQGPRCIQGRRCIRRRLRAQSHPTLLRAAEDEVDPSVDVHAHVGTFESSAMDSNESAGISFRPWRQFHVSHRPPVLRSSQTGGIGLPRAANGAEQTVCDVELATLDLTVQVGERLHAKQEVQHHAHGRAVVRSVHEGRQLWVPFHRFIPRDELLKPGLALSAHRLRQVTHGGGVDRLVDKCAPEVNLVAVIVLQNPGEDGILAQVVEASPRKQVELEEILEGRDLVLLPSSLRCQLVCQDPRSRAMRPLLDRMRRCEPHHKPREVVSEGRGPLAWISRRGRGAFLSFPRGSTRLGSGARRLRALPKYLVRRPTLSTAVENLDAGVPQAIPPHQHGRDVAMRPTQMGLPKLPRSPFVERVARSKGFTLVLLPGIHFPGLRLLEAQNRQEKRETGGQTERERERGRELRVCAVLCKHPFSWHWLVFVALLAYPFFKEAGFSGGHLHLLLAQRRLPLHKEMLLRDDDVAEQRLRGHDAADIANPQADVTASVADVRALPGGGVQAPVHETIGHELVHLLSCTILDVHIQRFLGNGPRLIAGIRRGLRRGGRGIAVRSLGHLGRLRIGNESNHVLCRYGRPTLRTKTTDRDGQRTFGRT